MLIGLNLSLTQGQKSKLKSAYRNNTQVSLQISPRNVGNGNTTIGVPKRDYDKVTRNASQGKGTRLTISQSNIRKSLSHDGGSFLSSLLTKALPLVIRGAKSALPSIAKGALESGTALGIGKLFGSGGQPNISIIAPLLKHLDSTSKLIPGIRQLFGGPDPVAMKKKVLDKLIKLSASDKAKLFKILGSGTRQGGALGALAAIGLPFLIDGVGSLIKSIKGGMHPLPEGGIYGTPIKTMVTARSRLKKKA